MYIYNNCTLNANLKKYVLRSCLMEDRQSNVSNERKKSHKTGKETEKQQ